MGTRLIRPRTVVGSFDPFAERNAITWGVNGSTIVRPSPTTTGVIPGVQRTTSTGDVTFSSSANQTMLSTDFVGRVTVTGTGQKYFRNCWFHGRIGGSGGYGALHGTQGGHGLIVAEDCTFDMDDPSVWVNGFLGHDVILRRCYFAKSVDAVGIHNTSAPDTDGNVLMELCYADDLYWDAADPNQSDGSHTDVIQLQGCNGTIIRGNYLRGFHDKSLIAGPPFSRQGYLGAYAGNTPDDTLARATSCIQITPNSGAIEDIVVDRNWFDGGEIMVNAGNDDNAGHFIGTFTNNVFYRTSYNVGYTLNFQSGATFSASNNTYDDGSAVTIRTNG